MNEVKPGCFEGGRGPLLMNNTSGMGRNGESITSKKRGGKCA